MGTGPNAVSSEFLGKGLHIPQDTQGIQLVCKHALDGHGPLLVDHGTSGGPGFCQHIPPCDWSLLKSVGSSPIYGARLDK